MECLSMVSNGLETLINIRNSIDLRQKMHLIHRSNRPVTSRRKWIFVIEHKIWWHHMFCPTLRVWWRSPFVHKIWWHHMFFVCFVTCLILRKIILWKGMCFETRDIVHFHLVPNSAVSVHEKMLISNAKVHPNIGKFRVINLHRTVNTHASGAEFWSSRKSGK